MNDIHTLFQISEPNKWDARCGKRSGEIKEVMESKKTEQKLDLQNVLDTDRKAVVKRDEFADVTAGDNDISAKFIQINC